MNPQELIEKDGKFRINVIDRINLAQEAIYLALHQDYSEGFVFDEFFEDEIWCGNISSEQAGDRTVRSICQPHHFGPLEHPQIILNCGWFPHSVMQQVRTHRVGVSFDVQSFRYTGNRISQVSNHEVDVEDVFYLRPVGFYTDRFGKKYEYTEEMRIQDLSHCLHAADLYEKRIQQGVSEEHARSIIPFDTRQHFVVSMNLRTAFHLLDMRYKSDAQLECQAWAHLLWLRIKEWVPEIAAWYEEKRLNRGRLAP